MSSSRSDAPLTIGIDLGTQSVRVVLVQEDGTVTSSGSAPLSSKRYDEVRHEQDPETWWEAVAQATREAGRDLGDTEVAGLAICSFFDTMAPTENHTLSLHRASESD